MSSVALTRESLPLSPCIGVCKLDPATGLCQGCYRTLDEIAAWSRSSTMEKRAVLARLEKRRPQLPTEACAI